MQREAGTCWRHVAWPSDGVTYEGNGGYRGFERCAWGRGAVELSAHDVRCRNQQCHR